MTAYPLFIPMYEALVGKALGHFSFFHLSPIFVLFQISVLVSLFRAARAVVGRTAALGATLCLALTPTFLDDMALAGFSDVPLSALVAAVVGAVLIHDLDDRTLRSPIPWLIAGLLTIKSEGTILFVVVIVVWLAPWVLKRRSVSPSSSWAALLLSAFMLRLAYLSYLTASDPTFGPINRIHLERAIAFAPEILRLCWAKAADPLRWGWFWWAFAGSAPLVLIAGRPRERAIAVASILSLACYTSAFGFTRWGLADHIGAFPRLLMHLAPAAVVLSCAYGIGVRGLARRAALAASHRGRDDRDSIGMVHQPE